MFEHKILLEKMVLENAWGWFDLHAKQRLTMIKFYMSIIGAISIAIWYLYRSNEWVLSAVLTVIALLVTGCFYLLDLRTSSLIKLGEDAIEYKLDDISKRYGVNLFNINYVKSNSLGPCNKGLSYGGIIRYLFAAIFSAFIIILGFIIYKI